MVTMYCGNLWPFHTHISSILRGPSTVCDTFYDFSSSFSFLFSALYLVSPWERFYFIWKDGKPSHVERSAGLPQVCFLSIVFAPFLNITIMINSFLSCSWCMVNKIALPYANQSHIWATAGDANPRNVQISLCDTQFNLCASQQDMLVSFPL